MLASHSASPLSYPRIYRASRGWLIALILCGAVLAIGGTIGAWFLAVAPAKNSQAQLWLVGLCLAFGLLGVYCILSTLRSRVLLFPDRIEVEELTRTAVLSREEIRGWRFLPTTPALLVLVPRDTSHRPVKVAQVFQLDPEFSEWLYTLPSLDNEDVRTSKVEIRNNDRLGATPGERIKKLAKGRRLSKILTVLALLATLWAFLYPIPYELTIFTLVALPWIAVEIVRRSGGLFRIDTSPNDAHPNVALPFIFPGLILLVRSVFDYNVLHSWTVAWLTFGIGALVSLSALKVDPTLRTKVVTIAGLFVFSLAYGYGVAIEANALLDRSPGTSYAANVEAKRIVTGKTVAYELDLGPWGPETKSNKLRVSRATYDPIQPGDLVYLTLKHGALGVKWYFMRAWQRGDPLGARQPPL